MVYAACRDIFQKNSLSWVEFWGSCVYYWSMTNRNDEIERLFRTHYARMHRLGVAILHDSDLARDVVHDIFASLLKAPDLSAVTSGYLMLAVRNRCLNHIRDCGIRYRIMARYLLDNGEYVGEKWPDEETIASIYSIIRSDISPQARRIMELRFSQEMPFARIAAEMGISETAVYRHLSHALRIIRQKLSENG